MDLHFRDCLISLIMGTAIAVALMALVLFFHIGHRMAWHWMLHLHPFGKGATRTTRIGFAASALGLVAVYVFEVVLLGVVANVMYGHHVWSNNHHPLRFFVDASWTWGSVLLLATIFGAYNLVVALSQYGKARNHRNEFYREVWRQQQEVREAKKAQRLSQLT